MQHHPLKNWIPYKLSTENGEAKCHWLNNYETPYTDPFFEETIGKIFSENNRNSDFRPISDLKIIEDWANDMDALQPAVIVFHISRCGSTLVSQLLSISDEYTMLAETPFLDDILRLPYKNANFGQKDVSSLFAAAVKFYGQISTGKEKHLVIKADSWHLFFYKQLRELYPLVPFILMYRSPDEVFSSNQKLRGIQAVQNLIEADVYGFDRNEDFYKHPDTYFARVLESFLDKTLEIAEKDNNALLINYNEGPMPIINKIADFVKLDFTPQHLADMTERSQYHSKRPGEKFSEDIIAEVPDYLANAMLAYQKLEEKRVNS